MPIKTDEIGHKKVLVEAVGQPKLNYKNPEIGAYSFSCQDSTGVDRSNPSIDTSIPKQKRVSELPAMYTDIRLVAAAYKDQFFPATHGQNKPPEDQIPSTMQRKSRWLEKVKELFPKEELEKGDNLSWSANHASAALHVLQTEAYESYSLT